VKEDKLEMWAYETFRLLDTSPTPWTIRPLNVIAAVPNIYRWRPLFNAAKFG